jgi:hypothetical protein
MYKTQLAKKAQMATFDASPYTANNAASAMDNRNTAASTENSCGLDELAKVAISSTDAGSYTMPPAPVRSSSPPKPVETAQSGLIQTNRPSVMLGTNDNSSEAAASASASTITSKLSSRVRFVVFSFVRENEAYPDNAADFDHI